MPFVSRPLEDRLAERTHMGEHCWLWTGHLSRTGYGQIRIRGKNGLAHRAAWEVAFGSIPDGAEVDHTCHVRNCVKPSHLRLVSVRQNTQNRAGKLTGKYSSKLVGVTCRGRRFEAQARIDGRKVYLGMFGSEQEAHEAYCAAVRETPISPTPSLLEGK